MCHNYAPAWLAQLISVVLGYDLRKTKGQYYTWPLGLTKRMLALGPPGRALARVHTLVSSTDRATRRRLAQGAEAQRGRSAETQTYCVPRTLLRLQYCYNYQ